MHGSCRLRVKCFEIHDDCCASVGGSIRVFQLYHCSFMLDNCELQSFYELLQCSRFFSGIMWVFSRYQIKLI